MKSVLITATLTVGALLLAPVVPSSDVGAGLAIVAIFVGVPVSILLYRDAARRSAERQPANSHTAFVTGLPIRLLGAVSALIGVALVVWVVYNIFVERQAAFTGIHSVFQLAIPLLLIAVGLRWARNPLGPSKGMWSSLWG